jgi:hypothetical protein
MQSKPEIYEEPSAVKAVDGSVEVEGPDAVDIAFTPEAAEETSERLLARPSRRADSAE